MKHLFPRVGEKSVPVATPEDRAALERKYEAVMHSWASRSIINATVRLTRVKQGQSGGT
jgi:hypothetical protein